VDQYPAESEEDRKRRKARALAEADLMVAGRYLYQASATLVRAVQDPEAAAAVDRIRADLVALMAGEDTPSEIAYGDLAADASMYADELEKLREELEEARGPHIHGKGK
jgi:hypothetical protein